MWWLLGGVLALAAALAGWAWLRWVRREMGWAAGPAFLLSDRRPGSRPWIAGAEPDPPRLAAGVHLGARFSRPAPSAESPALPVAGGVHALLVGGTRELVEPPLPPSDATLQFLPGRLLLPAGSAGGRELRFVRQPGAATEVTIGRQAGPADRHVQLLAPTVSRLHARLRWEAGRWSVADLSRTNPVRVNGRAVSPGAGAQVLRDGDRVGVGELELVFRER